MKKILAAILFLALATGAEAQTVYNRLYATQATIDFSLWKLDATGLKTDAADGGSDCSVIKDEGTETTCTNDFVDEGSSYSITLSSTEMTAARVVVHIIDQSSPQVFLDKVLIIETYGQTNSAQHPDGTYKTAQAGGASTITLASSETIGSDIPNNSTGVTIISGTGAGQTRLITDYDTSTKVATVGTAWTTQPSSDSVYELVAAPSGNATLGTDSITAASVSTDAGNKLADMFLRRTSANVEASSYGDTVDRKSLLGVIAQQAHKVSISGGTMTIYKSDGVTSLGTRTVTSSSGAAPITGLGN